MFVKSLLSLLTLAQASVMSSTQLEKCVKSSEDDIDCGEKLIVLIDL